MTKLAVATLCTLIVGWLLLHGQEQPEENAPRVVDSSGAAPGDAVVVFNGSDLEQWRHADGRPAEWEVRNGEMITRSGAGDVFSRAEFGSAQIHVEFATPSMPEASGQLRGNSGVYLQGRYEIQVLDSFENATYRDGMCGALYGIAAPLVNACRRPEEWQSYDVVFRAPVCEGERWIRRGRVTLLWNGVLAHDGVEVGETNAPCSASGPLMLQDHYVPGYPTPLRFRNIWWREL